MRNILYDVGYLDPMYSVYVIFYFLLISLLQFLLKWKILILMITKNIIWFTINTINRELYNILRRVPHTCNTSIQQSNTSSRHVYFMVCPKKYFNKQIKYYRLPLWNSDQFPNNKHKLKFYIRIHMNCYIWQCGR